VCWRQPITNPQATVASEVIAHEGNFVQPYGDPSGSFLVCGQIAGEPPRLFQIYSAGNFI
jgi:putative proteasome-type protease